VAASRQDGRFLVRFFRLGMPVIDGMPPVSGIDSSAVSRGPFQVQDCVIGSGRARCSAASGCLVHTRRVRFVRSGTGADGQVGMVELVGYVGPIDLHASPTQTYRTSALNLSSQQRLELGNGSGVRLILRVFG
jgi:hypothetical protein